MGFSGTVKFSGSKILDGGYLGYTKIAMTLKPIDVMFGYVTEV